MSMTNTAGRVSDTSSPAVHGRHDLIGSDRVEGTNVYRSDGTKIGEIERVMLDKFSGQNGQVRHWSGRTWYTLHARIVWTTFSSPAPSPPLRRSRPSATAAHRTSRAAAR